MKIHFAHRNVGIFFIIFFLVSGDAHAERVTAVTESLGKLQFINQNGDVDGFATEVAYAVAERAGYELDVALLPWARAYKLAQEQTDTLIFSIARTPQRETNFHWVGTLCHLPMFVWGLANRPPETFVNFDDLKAHSFVVTQGSRLDSYLMQREVENRIPVSSQQQVLGMMLRGRADFTITSEFMMAEKIANHGFDPIDFRPVFKIADMDNALSLAFGLDTDPALFNAFKQAFSELKDENMIADLSRKWGTRCR